MRSAAFLLPLLRILITQTTTHQRSTTVDAFVVSNLSQRSTIRNFSKEVFVASTQRCLSVQPADVLLDTATLQGEWFTSSLLSSSSFWSTITTLTLVFLLYTWEESIKVARRKCGPTLMPVVDSMLAEMGGLGFIGLFLSVLVTAGPLGPTVAALSQQFLGDEHVLLETFEFLHTAFFQVGVLFFIISGWTVTKVLTKIQSLSDFSKILFDANGDGNVCLEELADILKVDSILVDFNQDGRIDADECRTMVRSIPKESIWNELFISNCKIQAEALVMRERFVRLGQATPSFRIEAYCEQVFGYHLSEMVELSPLTWLPLVPAVAIGRSVDMSQDVISAASANAAASCGCFFGSAAFFGSSTVLALVTLLWGCFNFWKVSEIKQMLLPVLVRNSADQKSNMDPLVPTLSNGGIAKVNDDDDDDDDDDDVNGVLLLPPRYEDADLLQDFHSSPGIFGWIEQWLTRHVGADNDDDDDAILNNHVQLFGSAGKEGPELYRNSIKFHTWAVVVQIVFWGTQIVARDWNALLLYQENGRVWPENIGIPEYVVPELTIFGFYVALAVAQLFLVPLTFLSYSLITSVEYYFDDQFALDT